MFPTSSLVDINEKRVIHDVAQAPDIAAPAGWIVPVWDSFLWGSKNFELEVKTNPSIAADQVAVVIKIPGVYIISWNHFNSSHPSGTTAGAIDSSVVDLRCNGDLVARSAKSEVWVDATVRRYSCLPNALGCYCEENSYVFTMYFAAKTINGNFDMSGIGRGLSLTRIGSG
jgi:hypothetical protein